MTIIAKAKKLVEELGEEETIKVFEKQIKEFGVPKNFEELCIVTGWETAIQYIKGEIIL